MVAGGGVLEARSQGDMTVTRRSAFPIAGRGLRKGWRWGAVACWLLAILLAASAAACAPGGSKGTLPPPGLNGEIDMARTPDFVAVAGSDEGIAGYVRREYLFPMPSTTTNPAEIQSWPVYAEDLSTVVGHMVPGKGFVPLGINPGLVPDAPVQVGPSSLPSR